MPVSTCPVFKAKVELLQAHMHQKLITRFFEHSSDPLPLGLMQDEPSMAYLLAYKAFMLDAVGKVRMVL